MGERVKRIKTNVSEAQMAQAFIEAWKHLFNTTPSKEQIALLIAQNNLETAHRNSMWNFNVGNLTTNGQGQYNYFDDLTTNEQVQPGVWKKKNLKYRAYNSLEEGAEDYLRLLSGQTYSNVWKNIVNPNPSAFSHALKGVGYYTANEAPYTKDIVSLYNQFNKSNNYDVALSGKVPSSSPQLATNENFLEKFLHQLKNKSNNIFNSSAPSQNIDNILNSYLQSVLAQEKSNKKLYKKYLPYTQGLIKIESNDYSNSIEFGRVLSLALEEELMAQATVHTDGVNIDVSFSLPGPEIISIKSVQAITNAMSEAFIEATKKIGGIVVQTQLITNKTSFYHPINWKTADFQHRKFLLKFV